MKHFVKYFVVTFFLFICTQTIAEEKIVYIDMKYILNNSKAGKGAQDFLQKTFKEKQKKYADLEKKLKKEEEDLLSQKTVLEKEDFTKKMNNLRKNVIDYQADRRTSLEKISQQKADARSALLKKLDPILTSYIKENSVSVILDKKNVLLGNSELDITETITEKLNKELPSLNLK
jgi:outer membrane protein